MRGLAYYTGVVFERHSTPDASCAPFAAVGATIIYSKHSAALRHPPWVSASGDSVIAELLGEKQLLPELPRSLDAVVYAFSAAERAAAVRVACALRAENRSVELVLGEPRLKRVMADADRAGAREVHLLGPDEVARGEVLIRDLTSGEQRSEPHSRLIRRSRL